MLIDWLNFTPLSAAVGGMLIGLAASGLVLFTGRIAGISGILGGLLRPQRGNIGWRVAFLGGLMVSPAIFSIVARLPASQIDTPWPVLVLAGLLVGLGTRYGAGCTSGHGVCGLSRLSPRSLAAVLTFMAAGFLTVFITRHVLGV
jgi:uncharacterized protein